MFFPSWNDGNDISSLDVSTVPENEELATLTQFLISGDVPWLPRTEKPDSRRLIDVQSSSFILKFSAFKWAVGRMGPSKEEACVYSFG